MFERTTEESSWKILCRNPFTLYITFCTCIGFAFLGYYTGTIIHLLCIQNDFQSLLKEVFLGPNVVWSVFGAAIGCWTNGYAVETIRIADLAICLGGLIVHTRMLDVHASDDDDGALFISRLIVGVAIGILSMACPRYISRAPASTRIRGSLVRLHCICFAVGGCLSLCYSLFSTAQEPQRTADMIYATLYPAIVQLILTTIINSESLLWQFIKNESFISGKIKFYRLQSSVRK